MSHTRRTFLKSVGGASLVAGASGLSGLARGQQLPLQVVVVGGGFGGSTVAKYLRLWGEGTVNVTLIDPNPVHVSCILSNLILNNELTLADISVPHDTLSTNHGITIIEGAVTGVDKANNKVMIDGGSASVSYDKLIFAPGIAFQDYGNSWNQNVMPHAWIAGEQTNDLRDKVQAMNDGDTFVMTVPKSPYRCPPGPYERACLVADILSSKNNCKVVVLDANADIQAEKHTFDSAFTGIYGNIVEYYTNVTVAPGGNALQIVNNGGNGKLPTSYTLGSNAAVINFIADQRAPALLSEVGLVPAGGRWAPVSPLSYESTMIEDMYIIGDVQGTKQPKSGHMANSQAKVCADAIISEINGLAIDSPTRLKSIATSSSCFSPIQGRTASFLTGLFELTTDEAGAYAMKLKYIAEADTWTLENYQEMFTWADNLFTDSFV